MKTSLLGKTEMAISRIGLGSWAIGGQWEWGWGQQDDKDSIRTIHKALDMGINWIDTAPAYGLGHSEKIIAQALSETDQTPWVFTKCGIQWNSDGTNWPEIRADLIRQEVEQSLQRLHLDVIDLYQIHWPIPAENLDAAWHEMASLKQEGKVRHIGVSNCSLEQLQALERIAPVETLQPNYSLLVREPEQALLPYCLDHNIGVINYSPMGSGLLSGRMTPERIANLAEDDWRRQHDEFKEPRLTRNMGLVDLLRGMALEHDCSPGAMAIAWCAHNPAVSGAIVGLRKEDQVAAMCKAGDITLTVSNIRDINQFLAQYP